MKTITKEILKKLRVVATQEIFYSYSHWPTKEIDGVEFLSVVKRDPSGHDTQSVHWMRKDSLEVVK